MPELKPEGFVDAVRKVVQTMRYGPRELTLATFGLLLLFVLPALPTPAVLKPALSWSPWVGLLLLAWAAWLIWKKVVAPVPDAGKPKPPAIKGPAPFGPHDAELFARLGREDDLDHLRDWILNDQKPLVALMGESGVGKTSLLRAGLESHLKDDAVQVIYWEALPTDPEEGLLHAVQSHWGDSTTAPATFAGLASAVARGKRVVIIDQAEQLSPNRHRAIFEMLRQVATASPPYTATWVVAFRSEYSSVWRDFELDLPQAARHRLETLPLRRFLPVQAERAIAVLAEEGKVPIEQKVVKALVESIQLEGRVTPADIAISLLVLSEISEDKDSAFTLENFRERGGQVGLLERYLEGLLKNFPEVERREIFQALLSLIDLDNDQRLAEGLTPQELEKAARPANPTRFAAVLKFLSSGKARILEEVPEPPLRYRLIHERLIPAIRRLTGVLLAEAEQAGLLLDRAYRAWSRDQKARYLLSGRELRQVQRFRGQLAWGAEADQKREYLRLSRQRRNRLWLSAAIILMSLGPGIYLYSEHRSQNAAKRALLVSWQLPPDLLDHLDQIEQLTLPKGVTRVDWLKKAHYLRYLEIEDGNETNLEGLPEGLRTLKVGSSIARELPLLPADLVSLEISDYFLKNLKGLPPGLLALSIECDSGLLATFHLPVSLEYLALSLSERVDLDISYLKNLTSISLASDSEADDEQPTMNLKLPRNIRSLAVDDSLSPASWKSLPQGLESLSCSGFYPEPEFLPKRLSRLYIRPNYFGVPAVPGNLNVIKPRPLRLVLDDEHLGRLPILGLASLDIFVQERMATLNHFPSTLKVLRIYSIFGENINQKVELTNLPPELTELAVSGLAANFPQSLPKGLKRLELDQGSLPELPKGLISLTYSAPLRAPLPASLRSLTIRVGDQDLPYLTSLSALNQLHLLGPVTRIPSHLSSLMDLDIKDTEIHSLQGLPPDLISLTLRPGQVRTLRGLPKSVVALHFRSSEEWDLNLQP